MSFLAFRIAVLQLVLLAISLLYVFAAVLLIVNPATIFNYAEAALLFVTACVVGLYLMSKRRKWYISSLVLTYMIIVMCVLTGSSLMPYGKMSIVFLALMLLVPLTSLSMLNEYARLLTCNEKRIQIPEEVDERDELVL